MPHSDPVVRLEYMRRYRAMNRDHLNDLARTWYASNIDKERPKKRNIRRTERAARPFRETCRRLRIDECLVEKALRDQEGRCAICHLPETVRQTGRVKRLCVDHDHSTGRFRGLLCTRCNKVLGVVKDDVALLGRMVVYLSRYVCEEATAA